MSHDSLGSKIRSLDREMLRIKKEKELIIKKGLESDNVDDILNAETFLNGSFEKKQSKSYVMSPDNVFGNDSSFVKPPKLDMGILRQMARTPLVKAIIGTKLSEVDSFSTASSDDNAIGWRIRKKTSAIGEDDGEELSDKDKKIIDELTEHLEVGGSKSLSRKEPIRNWLAYQTKDSQELDQATFEVVRDRSMKVIGWKSTDAATFRLVDPIYVDNNKGKIKKIRGSYPEYVQIYDVDRVYADFYPFELSFGIRNLTTDVNRKGYGIAELEDLVQTVTWMMNSDDYNGRFFRQGSSPKGMLLVKNAMSSPALGQFKEDFNAQLTGVENAWRSFVLEADSAEWINMQMSNNDMQFSTWNEYLIRITCANFKVDPTEVGFHMTGNTSGDAYSSHKQRTDYSKEKSLFPMLQFHQNRINWYIRQYLESRNMPVNYEFVFTGMSPQDEDAMIKHDISRITNWSTINEIRESRGKPPIEGGDIILSSTYLQAMMQNQMNNEANGVVDDDVYNENNYEIDDDVINKSISDNPIMRDTLSWIRDGAKPTITNSLEVLMGRK